MTKNELTEKTRMYRILNEITLKNEIVIFGSDFTANFPFYELSQKYVLSNAIYNRSIPNLTLDNAEEALRSCVLDIKPEKVFLSLGEHDVENTDAMKTYRRILEKLHEALPRTQIYILSLCGKDASASRFNLALRALAKEMHVTFIIIGKKDESSASYADIFKTISRFFRKAPLNFADAIQGF